MTYADIIWKLVEMLLNKENKANFSNYFKFFQVSKEKTERKNFLMPISLFLLRVVWELWMNWLMTVWQCKTVLLKLSLLSSTILTVFSITFWNI